MKKLKIILAILGICTLSLNILAACGTSSSKNINNQTSSINEENKNTNDTYNPVTITVDLLRSGDGEKLEETFTAPPSNAVTIGDEFTDILLDLGLEKNMAGRTEGSCKSVRTTFDEIKKSVPVLGDKNLSKENLLAAEPDFIMGWDSNFSDKKYGKDFCMQNGINIYTPKFTSDNSTIEDLYEDYLTLGKIFNVSSTAEEKVNIMKNKINSVESKIKEAGSAPKKVFIYDSGKDAPFTGCQGMPGSLLKIAGGISIFDDINKGWATVSWEEVVNRNPEVIIIMNYNNQDVQEKEDFLYSNSALSEIDAIKNKRIYPIILSDIEGGAGSADVVEDLAKVLYPELY